MDADTRPLAVNELEHWQIMLLINDVRLGFEQGKGTLGEVTQRVLTILGLTYSTEDDDDGR